MAHTTHHLESRFSIAKMRMLILVCLTVGVAAYTAVMLSNTSSLSERFGPQVRADLEWRVLRGAQELARVTDLGLVTGDAELVRQNFGVYAKTRDVAAIIAVNDAGVVIAQHGNAPEPLSVIFRGAPDQLREGSGYLVSWANASIEGAPVGKVAVVVSTQRHTDAVALLSHARHAALAGGIAALVLGFVVVGFFTRAVALRDAQLSDHAESLERKVEARTRELDERNRGMRLVFDNVAQGFLTVETSGLLSPERSAVVDRWFGPPGPGQTLSEYLAPRAPNFAGWFAMGLEQLRDDVMPAELVLDQLPARFTAGGLTFDVAYSPILRADGQTERLLVIVSDVTHAIEQERSEREQKELVGLFQRISVDRAGVEEFLTEAAGLVSALRTETDPVVQQRLVHTLKGNCAIYGLLSYAQLAHQVESDLAESGGGLSDAQRTGLVAMWKEAMVRVGQLLGGVRRDALEVERGELDSVLAQIAAGTPASSLVTLLQEWLHEPVVRRLERLARQARSVARRIGKPEPTVEILGSGIRLDPDGLRAFWSAMVHVVRNAVDHGIGDAEERLARGKPEAGLLRFSAARVDGRVAVSVSDDGEGIRWEKLREKARALGLPHAEQHDLVEALFSDGVSTRDDTTETSGRGVGLAALRQVVSDLNGTIDVHSEPGLGTTFTFSFEEKTNASSTRGYDLQKLASLMPGAS